MFPSPPPSVGLSSFPLLDRRKLRRSPLPQRFLPSRSRNAEAARCLSSSYTSASTMHAFFFPEKHGGASSSPYLLSPKRGRARDDLLSLLIPTSFSSSASQKAGTVLFLFEPVKRTALPVAEVLQRSPSFPLHSPGAYAAPSSPSPDSRPQAAFFRAEKVEFLPYEIGGEGSAYLFPQNRPPAAERRAQKALASLRNITGGRVFPFFFAPGR